MRRAGLVVVALFWLAPSLVWLAPVPADAKEGGVRSPSARRIYKTDETFSEICNQNRRNMVVEVAMGAGPEGNLGLLLGYLPKAIKGWEFYAGIGVRTAPALHLTGSVRRTMNFAGWRPYVSAGYLWTENGPIGTRGHNVFGEVGYKWIVHHTYHLTFGLGLRYLAHVEILDDSLLNDPAIDPVFRDDEVDNVWPWLPTAALRFSRAF